MRKQQSLNIWEIVNEMKVGWNLGNSLETLLDEGTIEDYEISWGNPKTTKEMILKIKQAGFKTIRVPVTWAGKIGRAPNYTINKKWLERVQEVVDYAYYEGMYVIINAHHEDEWLWLGNTVCEEKAKDILERLWTQIAEKFCQYDYHLIFETMNETRLIGTKYEWNAGTVEARKVINEFNTIAVNAIRKSGENNTFRPIIIKSIGGRYSIEAIKDVEVPNDDAMIILSVHAYVPYYFCMVPEKSEYWGTDLDKRELSDMLEGVSKIASAKGVPVIVGEFGTINKQNEEIRAAYTSYFVSQARMRNITCIIWDNNVDSIEINNNLYSYSIFDRDNLQWRYPKILSALIDNS